MLIPALVFYGDCIGDAPFNAITLGNIFCQVVFTGTQPLNRLPGTIL